MGVSEIINNHPTEAVVKTPSAECLECKLFLTFIRCYGLTFEDIRKLRG